MKRPIPRRRERALQRACGRSMNPEDPESAQRIVAEYAGVAERHAASQVHPAPVRMLPYPKQTIKAAIVTCVRTLRHSSQLTDEIHEFLEGAYVGLADYVEDELARVMTEYREASAAMTGVPARDRAQTPAWRTLAATGQLAGEIARTITEDAAALRREFQRQTTDHADDAVT